LKIVDRGYVLEQGSIVESGTSQELRENDHIKKAYMGLS
jgi:branched-chain amino acid transport system ATP-binding protein